MKVVRRLDWEWERGGQEGTREASYGLTAVQSARWLGLVQRRQGKKRTDSRETDKVKWD